MRSKHGRWSEKYDACVECGRTDSRYYGFGLCTRCKQRQPGTREYQNAWRRNKIATDPAYRERERLKKKLNAMKHDYSESIKRWRKSQPGYSAAQQRKWRFVEIAGTGIIGNRIGKEYRLDGERVWNMLSVTGNLIEAVPSGQLRRLSDEEMREVRERMRKRPAMLEMLQTGA